MSELQLLSIGDTTMDTFLDPIESEAMCDLREHEQFICFGYGDKIPVKTQQFSLGGNAANNAVGTKRLGVNSAIATVLGDDLVADQTLSMFKKENVGVDFIVRQENSPSNYSTVIRYGGERTIFTYRPERKYDFPREMPRVEWAYLTSMAENFEDYYTKVVDWAKQYSVKVAFNPGSRQVRAGREKLQNVLDISHIIYINRKEAEMLTGLSDTAGKEKQLLEAAVGMGPKIAIITDGERGSYIYDGKDYLHSSVLPVSAYERTGAGDAFGSGCISALIKGKPLNEALIWGTVNGASVVGYVGAQRGLLKEADMPLWLERAQSSEVKVTKL